MPPRFGGPHIFTDRPAHRAIVNTKASQRAADTAGINDLGGYQQQQNSLMSTLCPTDTATSQRARATAYAAILQTQCKPKYTSATDDACIGAHTRSNLPSTAPSAPSSCAAATSRGGLDATRAVATGVLKDTRHLSAGKLPSRASRSNCLLVSGEGGMKRSRSRGSAMTNSGSRCATLYIRITLLSARDISQ